MIGGASGQSLTKAATVQSGTAGAICSGYRAAAASGVSCTCPVTSGARQSLANNFYYCIVTAACGTSPCSAATSYSFISTYV